MKHMYILHKYLHKYLLMKCILFFALLCFGLSSTSWTGHFIYNELVGNLGITLEFTLFHILISKEPPLKDPLILISSYP